MKSIVLVSAVAILSNLSFAEVKRVHTDFWSAPMESEHVLDLSITKDISSTCAQFTKRVFNQDGEIRGFLSARSFLRNRSLPAIDAPIDVNDFYVDIDLGDHLEFGNHLVEVTSSNNEKAKSKSLPYYYQYKATSGAVVSQLEDLKIELLDENMSLIKAARELEVAPSEIEIISKGSKSFLRLFGRDAACDFMNGKIVFSGRAPGFINVDEKEFQKMERFYNFKLAPTIKNVLGKKKSDFKKSALLGFRFGKILEDESKNYNGATDKQIEELMEVFFQTNSLKPSSNLLDIEGDFSIKLEGQTGIEKVNVKFMSKRK